MKYNQLTPADYTDEGIFNQELAKIFANSWQFVGLKEDLTQVGDYLTLQVGNIHLVVYINEQGKLAAFHNTCRHRGMQLLEGQGKLPQAITCPYHNWRYNRQGELLSIPNQRNEFSSLDKSCYSLKHAQAGIWRGMIWVHPDINATPVAEYFAAMNAHLAPYQVEDLAESKDEVNEYIINANWKIIAENYIDQYHLSELHSATLNMYAHHKALFGTVKSPNSDEHFYFWESVTQDYLNNIETNAPYPLLMDKNHPKIGAFVPLLFPNLGLSETESSWSCFHIQPITVDKTKVIIRSKVKNCSSLQFIKQATRSHSYWQKVYQQQRNKAQSLNVNDKHPLGGGDFMAEDVFVCEQLQKSLTNPHFEFGPSAEHGESMIRAFQQQVKRRLTQ